MSLLIEQISYLLVFLLLTLNKQMFPVFNVCLDSSDAAIRDILKKKKNVFKSSWFLKNNFQSIVFRIKVLKVKIDLLYASNFMKIEHICIVLQNPFQKLNSKYQNLCGVYLYI